MNEDLDQPTKAFWNMITQQAFSPIDFLEYIHIRLAVSVGNYQSIMEWYPLVLNQDKNDSPKLRSHNRNIINHLKRQTDFNNPNLYLYFNDAMLNNYLNITPLNLNDIKVLQPAVDFYLVHHSLAGQIEVLLKVVNLRTISQRIGLKESKLENLFTNHYPDLAKLLRLPFQDAEKLGFYGRKALNKISFGKHDESLERNLESPLNLAIYKDLSVCKDISPEARRQFF